MLGHQLDRLRRHCHRQHKLMLRLGDVADQTCADRRIPIWLPDRRRNPLFDAVRAEVGFTAAWQQWSATLHQSLVVAERIRRNPACSLCGLSIKHRALLWELCHDEAAMDDLDRRRLVAFGRELGALAMKPSTGA